MAPMMSCHVLQPALPARSQPSPEDPAKIARAEQLRAKIAAEQRAQEAYQNEVSALR
jgi:hypothetical protein